ncbi:interleukin-21 receptor-like isoform X3 [Sparus aurata]|nr:interleukin-21 receptor-like isoform X3 [Sparus aurata]XP_030250671.1 interleukin-21 receptor-like isoform X3 [Sparus aurata]XP_030250672.1 interleukin-21 receptor-like isoform X3 [Sparus aurata]
MKGLSLLLVSWYSGILAVTSSIKVDGKCLTDYRDTVTCVLNITGNLQEQSAYSLKFTHYEVSDRILRLGEILCPIEVMNKTHSYICKLKDDPNEAFESYDSYVIELCHESGCYNVTKERFQPCDNIQLTPPIITEVQLTPETINITWRSGYEHHPYFESLPTYELLLESSQKEESKTLHPKSQRMSESIRRSEFIEGALYCIKVRSNIIHREYKATWSEWSPATCIRNGAEEEQDNILVILTKTLGPLCVAVGVLLFVFWCPAARMKIKTLSHTPSPAPFFKPLFQQHEGNLQEWLSPQGKIMLTYKPEEILTIDCVIASPKPPRKHPEENQDFNIPAVTQLAFPQCPSSYVGLPGIHEAPPPITMVCPSDMSYTQLPCSVWGVGFGAVQVASSPPEDILNISSADSGCTFEDLTQSPECSVPNSPVDDSPPPCICTDYCILNKTAEGFAPVLVSKGSSGNVPFDSLQEVKS